MKIVKKSVETKQELILGHLKVGDTFMFTNYDLNTGPFLVINGKGYCKPYTSHHGTKSFVLNLAEDTVHYRTVIATVKMVNCTVAVG